MTAELKIREKRRSWNRDRVIGSIQDRHHLGLALNPQLLQHEDASLLAAGRRYFGSWPQALRAAGVPPLQRLESPRHQRGYWTRERLITEIRRHAAQGHPLYAHAMQQLDNRLVSACTYHFGCWANALQQSGFDPQSIRANVHHSPDSVTQQIQQLLTTPDAINDATIRAHHRTLYWAARKYFGSWRNAVAQASRSAPQAKPASLT